jgi:hypothetical protein
MTASQASGPVMLGAPKDSLEPKPLIPEGRYTVRCDGFKPKASKNEENPSVNLNPILKIINHPTLNGEQVYIPLNQNAGFILKDFSHMLGMDHQEAEDTVSIPGHFMTNPQSPKDYSQYRYQGPCLGQTGDLLVAHKEYKNKPSYYVKAYFCRKPGCTDKHSTELT